MIIPSMTDPLGTYWDQPSKWRIELDDIHALMERRDLNELSDYSHSTPSAVYAGKMWKCKFDEGWLLRWYSNSKETKDHCDINQRIILIA